MRALVVDDSKTMRMILKQILESLNYEVIEAEQGLEALEKLRGVELPELALVDWNMPVMKGIDLVRALRDDEHYAGMRIMMVTTETELEQVRTALVEGADEYVMKPFTREVILEKLEILGLNPS